MKGKNITDSQLRKTVNRSLWRRGFLLLSLVLGCFALSPIAQAVTPAVAAASASHAPTIDFTSSDVPLYQQIMNRIWTHILTRLGDGPTTRERYFIIPFAYQNKDNDPEYSHSFICVIRVFADNRHRKPTPALPTGNYRNWNFDAFTISWLPQNFMQDPHVCVFEGFGSLAIPNNNTCPISEGRNFSLEETIKLAVREQNAVAMWGPYEIAKPGFDFALKRKTLLDGGTIGYRADDRLSGKDRVAINCFHAMAALEELYPDAALFDTGLKMWGFNGTAHVLIEYNNDPRFKGLLLEPIDVKNDRYDFVYAPPQNRAIPLNPTRKASAYRI